MTIRHLIIYCAFSTIGCNNNDVQTPTVPQPPPDAGNILSTGPAPQFGSTVTAQTPPPPLSGGTLILLRDGITAAASDPDRDQIYLADLKTHTLRATLRLDAGDEPGRLVEDGAGRVHVVLRHGGALYSFDPTSRDAGTRRAVCPAPRGVAWDKQNDVLHVACAGGELVTLPAGGGAPTRVLQLERDLRDVAVVGSELWVTTFRKAQLLTVSADGVVSARSDLPSGPDVSDNFFVPAVAWRMLPLGDGQVAVVHQLASTHEVIPAPGGYGGAGNPCGGISRSAVTTISGPDKMVSRAVGSVVLPVDIAWSPNHSSMAIVSAGNSHTSVLQQVMVIGFDGNAAVPDPGNCEFGQGINVSGEVTALTYDGDGYLWVQTREPATLQRVESTFVSIPLSKQSRADTGWAVFHSNSGADLACASCHPEGGDDGHVWQFTKIGARRTQSVRGHVSETAPFHWSGDVPTTDALISEVWVNRMAGPSLEPAQGKALFDWIDSIPLLPQSPPTDTASVERGDAMFHSREVGCASCHFGSQLTNNATVDVGTGGKFQVPRLVGVAWRAPFLHDGCAATLTDRFGACGGGNFHGATEKLSASQVADLVAYLETL